MKKKIYILALTFLCLLFSQMSFGQPQNEGGGGSDQLILHFYEELFGFEISNMTLDSNNIATSFTTTDGIFVATLYEVVVENNYHPPTTPPTDPDPTNPDPTNPDPNPDPCPSGDYDDCYGTGSPTPPAATEYIVRAWYLDYDSDNYHGLVYYAVNQPGSKWKPYTSGLDCDDLKPEYTTVCCTTTCDSGYKLNPDTCECVELPPCFNTIYELDTTNAFDTNKILINLESFLQNFGIESDLIDFMKEQKLLDPSILFADIQTYIKASDYLGNTGDAVGTILNVSKYLNEPKTENLLRVSFDLATLALPPGSSLFLSVIELYELRDGKTIIDHLLIEAAKIIEKQMGCNLGKGVHGKIGNFINN